MGNFSPSFGAIKSDIREAKARIADWFAGVALQLSVSLVGRFARYELLTKQVLPIRVVLGGKCWNENYTTIIDTHKRKPGTKIIERVVIAWNGVPNDGMRPVNLCASLIYLAFYRKFGRENFPKFAAYNKIVGRYSTLEEALEKGFYTTNKAS
jgi:hypothetical protein